MILMHTYASFMDHIGNVGLFLCAPSPQLRQRKHSSLESVLKPKTATGKGSAPSRIGTIFHGATKIGTKMVQEHGNVPP